jgi:hypothetical protein
MAEPFPSKSRFASSAPHLERPCTTQLESLICIIVNDPGTVDLRAQSYINGASISGNIVHGCRPHSYLTGIVDISAVQRTAYEQEISGGAAGAPLECNGRGRKC